MDRCHHNQARIVSNERGFDNRCPHSKPLQAAQVSRYFEAILSNPNGDFASMGWNLDSICWPEMREAQRLYDLTKRAGTTTTKP